MKICFLAAANSIHSYRWIRYFTHKGYEVYWISLTPLDFEPIKNVNFYEIKQFPIKPLNIFYYAIKVRMLTKNIKPDIMHAHYAGTYGLIGALSGHRPFILTAWGSDVLITAKSKLKRPFIKYALNKADLITCDAHHMINAMARLGINNKKIKLVYFGTDTDKFYPNRRDEKFRNKLDISNSPTIISLRNLEPIYDVESLIKAVPYVLKVIPDAKFIIAGRGSQEMKLKRLARALGVSGNLRFIGHISNDELNRYLTSADIYVSTSLSDAGIAASTAEAMACGLSVVITDSGENRNWIKDGESGFVIPGKDPETLSEKVIYLIKNKGARKRFGKIGREIIIERNNYYKEMSKMESLYSEKFGG